MDAATARGRLEEIRAELGRSITVLDRADARHEVASEYPQDAADAGANLSENERADAVLAAARRQLDLVLEALARIDHGTYGMCVDCGGPVPEGRLEAKPEAARCVACQARRDRRRR